MTCLWNGWIFLFKELATGPLTLQLELLNWRFHKKGTRTGGLKANEMTTWPRSQMQPIYYKCGWCRQTLSGPSDDWFLLSCHQVIDVGVVTTSTSLQRRRRYNVDVVTTSTTTRKTNMIWKWSWFNPFGSKRIRNHLSGRRRRALFRSNSTPFANSHFSNTRTRVRVNMQK